jgi:phospholipid/cholesterol/gamma-HCH transport system substrate-binding protein
MKSFRERRAWLVGSISIIAIAVGVTGAFSINSFPALRGVYTISADLRDAAGLRAGNEVRVAGVKVGKVTTIELTPDAARVSMEVEDNVQLPRETKVEVKLRTLLGQKFIDLQFPRGFLTAASGGNDPSDATSGYLAEGDVIPRSQTKIPFEIYQAANEGTEVLSGIDKKSLRKMIDVLATTVDTSKEELGRAVVALNRATDVLGPKSKDISALLRNSEKVTKTLASGGRDLEGILDHGAEVLGVLSERRQTVSSLLAATNDLSLNLGLLIQNARGSIELSVTDLNTILAAAEEETEAIDAALAEFGTAQEMFGRPLTFGRFIEGHVCAIGGADSCVPKGSPADPGFPFKGAQPVSRPGGQQ